MFFLLQLECTFSGLERNEIVGSYNLRSLGVPLSLLTIYNTNTNKKNTHRYIDTKGVYMRSEIKFARNEISFSHNKNYVYISFQKLSFDLLINYPCFYEKFACANVSSQMISFRGMYHPKWNFISIKMTAMK